MKLEIPAGVASAVYDLEVRERRFRAVFESARDAIMIFDDGGHILDANPAAAALFATPPEELRGRPLDDFSSETHASLWTKIRSAGSRPTEIEILRSDGERRLAESNLTADFVFGQHVGVLREFTDERTHERERLRLAERFERLFRTDLVGMALINRQSASVVDCNGKLAEFFGRTPDAFIGQRVADLGDFFADRERYARLIAAWAAGTRFRSIPVQSVLPDGTVRYGLATLQSLPAVGNQGPVDVVVLVDVTEQHRLEAELRQMYELEAIGRLAGGIAHEFNNLLAVISGFAALLEATVAGDREGRESVDEIKRATHRAAKLVHGLLAFSKRETFDLQEVDAHAVIQRSAGALHELLGPQVQLVLRLEASSPWVRTDPLQIEHALQQLAANSRDAMPDGGIVTIETADADTELKLSVRDSGTGMDSSVLERAFEPFFTTKPLGVGTGLGLSTVYGIVAQSGGHVSVESEPLKGTAVHLFFQSTSPGPVDLGMPETDAQERIGGTETILFVEERPTVALLVESFLSRFGYRVVRASGAAEALQIASERGDRIDLVISRFGITAASGATLLEELRSLRPSLPAVLVASASEAPAGESATSPTAILHQPYTMADLTAMARRLLDGVQV